MFKAISNLAVSPNSNACLFAYKPGTQHLRPHTDFGGFIYWFPIISIFQDSFCREKGGGIVTTEQ